MRYKNVREEELKNKIAQDYFWNYDCSKIVGNVDFSVKAPFNPPEGGKNSPPLEGLGEAYFLWAEAKRDSSDIYRSIAQLTLTIGKARTFDKILPPHFLGAFDGEKIAFVPYSDIQDIFYQNDFNWNVAPSDYGTKEFQMTLQKVKESIENESFLFYYDKEDKELKKFIKNNFIVGKFGLSKIKIDKNNFITVYNKWIEAVKPTIAVNCEAAKRLNIIDGDFYLADLLSKNNETIKEKLFVWLKSNIYKYNRAKDALGEIFREAYFNDNQKAHTQFWTKYERPPAEEYWDYIVDRRDLIVPQDIRERKGSFYTPKIWVEYSQKYLADVFGDDWQDEYYVWDCAAGTGNLLAGLTNKNNIWASTLDKQDVDIMCDRIENGANLWKQQVFQFDFLNDEFIPISKGGKLPDELFDIISDENKRKKLIIYINPPYAEAGKYGEESKSGVSKTYIYEKYKKHIGYAATELFTQFMIRVSIEISGSKLAVFSKLKYINAPNFNKFRELFKANYLDGFIVRANTFDNVIGQFPVSFLIWDLSIKKKMTKISCDVLDNEGRFSLKKTYFADLPASINKWIALFNKGEKENIGFLSCATPMFQNQNYVYIESKNREKVSHYPNLPITNSNLIEASIYFAVRKVIPATWLNDRDQFLYPNHKWKKDIEFQNDCLTYTLFHNSNNISTVDGVNHWIPFAESEVGSQGKYASHFMTSFISGKIIQNNYASLFDHAGGKYCIKREFSPEAKKVFDAGRELWKYYHKQPNVNVNASLYDIREYFQGRNENGKMNNKSDDEKYNELIENLRFALRILAKKIEPKVYEYGFLKY